MAEYSIETLFVFSNSQVSHERMKSFSLTTPSLLVEEMICLLIAKES